MGFNIYRPDNAVSTLDFCSLPSATQRFGVCNSYVRLVRGCLTWHKMTVCMLCYRLMTL